MPSLSGDLNSYRRPAACMILRMHLDFSDKNRDLGTLYASHVEEICRRHDHALERAGASHAVIFSGAPKYAFLDDNTYPFRANPHFVGWAPLTGLPLSYIVYSPGETPVLVYYQPRDYWHPVPGSPDGYWTSHFDIRIVDETDEVAAHLPHEREKCILIGEVDDAGHAFGIDRVNPTTAINILHHARGSSKTAYELACMRLAARRGVLGHRAAARAFAEGLSEFSIHQAFCEATVHSENELPYGNIIAINEHGAILHYTDLEREPPAEIRSFLIDAGARVHGYASDITRTYSNGDTRFSELIARMEALQQDVVNRVKAGVDYRELHLHTHRLIAGVLVDSGLANGDVDALLAEGVTSAFVPHGVGHLLGIQVHDVAGFMENESGATIDPPSGHPYLRLTRVLEEDMVLTIEPGIYFIDMLLDNLRGTPAETFVEWGAVDGLRPFGGIRIEDDIRVLADGHENLSRDAFAEL